MGTCVITVVLDRSFKWLFEKFSKLMEIVRPKLQMNSEVFLSTLQLFSSYNYDVLHLLKPRYPVSFWLLKTYTLL